MASGEGVDSGNSAPTRKLVRKVADWAILELPIQRYPTWEDLLGDSAAAREAIGVWREWGVPRPARLVAWDVNACAAPVFDLLEPPPLWIRKRYGLTYPKLTIWVDQGFNFVDDDELIDFWLDLQIRPEAAREFVDHMRAVRWKPEEYGGAVRRLFRIARNVNTVGPLWLPSAQLIELSPTKTDEELRRMIRWPQSRSCTLLLDGVKVAARSLFFAARPAPVCRRRHFYGRFIDGDGQQ